MTHFQQQNIKMNLTPQQKRMMNSGGGTNKRCVSETKKEICSFFSRMEMCYVC